MSKTKLIGIDVKDYKRIQAFELGLNEDGGLVLIKGPNEQGKSSLINAIQCLFEGKKVLKGEPIRRSAKNATIIGHLSVDGEKFVARRRFTPKSDDLVITKEDGTEVKSPATFMKNMINALTFNPMPFIDSKPADKLATLMKVGKVDLSLENSKIANLTQERLLVGREIKSFGEISYVPGLKEVKVSELIAEKKKIETINEQLRLDYDAKCEKERSIVDKWNEGVSEIISAKLSAQNDIDKLKSKRTNINDSLADLQERKNEYKHQIEELQAKIKSIDDNMSIGQEQFDNMTKEIIKKDNDLACMPETPEKKLFDKSTVETPYYKSTEDIDLKIQNAEDQNKEFFDNEEKRKKYKQKESKKEIREELTTEIEKYEAQKIKKLSEADFGVPGLSITESDVFMNGAPSEEWSSSLGMITACQLCIAQNPDLKSIFLDNADLIGRPRMEVLRKWAEDNNILAILTKVDDDILPADKTPDNVFYIVDGNLA